MNQKGALRLEAVCARAADAGLAPGTMLADARAMVPTLQVRAADPAADARLLEDLAAWCERYTPYVAIDRSHPGAGGGALWLDVTGCAHLFGGEAGLRADLLARLRRQGLAAAAAIADAPGAAWALARYGDDAMQIVPPGGARVALAPLPVAALRLDPDAVRMLERLGLERIERLYPLPRRALVARFGEALTTRLDQAQGVAPEPIAPRPPCPAHRAQLTFAEPIAHAEALAAVTRRLLAELCAGLAAAGLGARRLTLACYRVDNSTAAVAIGTSRPCRDARQLERLLAEKLERVDLGFGIERALLEADAVEPLLPEPLAWRQMGAGDLDQARDLAPGPGRGWALSPTGPGAAGRSIEQSPGPRRGEPAGAAREPSARARPGAGAGAERDDAGAVSGAQAAWPGAGAAAASARPAGADRGGGALARRAAGAVPLAARPAQGRQGQGPGAPGAGVVAHP